MKLTRMRRSLLRPQSETRILLKRRERTKDLHVDWKNRDLVAAHEHRSPVFWRGEHVSGYLDRQMERNPLTITDGPRLDDIFGAAREIIVADGC